MLQKSRWETFKIKLRKKKSFFPISIVAAIQGQTQKIKNDSIEFEQSSEWKTERKKGFGLDLLRSTEKKWANLTFCHKLFWTLDTTFSKFTKRIICLKEFTVYIAMRRRLICHLQYLSVNYVRWTTKDLVGSSKMLWSSSSKMYLKHLQN